MNIEKTSKFLTKVESFSLLGETSSESEKTQNKNHFAIRTDQRLLINQILNEMLLQCTSLKHLSIQTYSPENISQCYSYFSNLKTLNLKLGVSKQGDADISCLVEKFIPVLASTKYMENFGLKMFSWGKNAQEQLVKLHQLECMQKLRTYSLHVIKGTNFENFGIKLNQVSKFIDQMKSLENLELYFDKVIGDLNDEEFWNISYLQGLKHFSLEIPSYQIKLVSRFFYQHLAKMQNLETLTIIKPDFGKLQALSELPNFPKLRTLNIQKTKDAASTEDSINIFEYLQYKNQSINKD